MRRSPGLGLAGSVAVHPLAVAVGGLFSLFVPAPWFGALPRGLDLCVRNSTFRAGYELLYAPLQESAKRRSKAFIDVGCDAGGKAIGALVALPLSSIGGAATIMLISTAGLAAAAAEFAIARRIHPAYVGALQEGLRRRLPGLVHPMQLALGDFTIARSMVGINRRTDSRRPGRGGAFTPATGQPVPSVSLPTDPIVVLLDVIRSGESTENPSEALRDAPDEPLIVAALIPLLEHWDLVKPVVDAPGGADRPGGRAACRCAHGGRLARGIVRRRLPEIVLMSWNSPRAVRGLIEGLQDRKPGIPRLPMQPGAAERYRQAIRR